MQQIAELERNTVPTQQQVKKIIDFVNLMNLIYSSWWMTCSSVTDAPWNVLKLYHSFLQSELLSALVSTSAVNAFKRHLW